MTRPVQSQLETAIEEHFKQYKNASNGLTRTSLSVTVSTFVEENLFIYFLKSAKTTEFGAVSLSVIAQHVKT